MSTAATASPSGLQEASATLQVNPLTVGKAYGELEREGLIEARRGLGMFVTEGKVASAGTRREAARQAAERLALEAAQAGLTLEQASRLLAEGFARIQKGDRHRG